MAIAGGENVCVECGRHSKSKKLYRKFQGGAIRLLFCVSLISLSKFSVKVHTCHGTVLCKTAFAYLVFFVVLAFNVFVDFWLLYCFYFFYIKLSPVVVIDVLYSLRLIWHKRFTGKLQSSYGQILGVRPCSNLLGHSLTQASSIQTCLIQQ